MIQILGPVLVVLILVVGWLIATRMTQTHTHRKSEWRRLSNRADLAEMTIGQIANELNLAQSANVFVDTLVLDTIIRQYETDVKNSNKEIA